MADVIDTDIARRIAGLLREQADAWSAAERAEVNRFLDAGEYGLALDTLAWILVEEAKPISPGTLCEIESLAAAMGLADDPFLDAVRNARKRQTA